MAGALLGRVLVALGGPGPTGQTINEWCPVMTEERSDPAITVEYQGKTVAFCCDRCLGKFLEAPQKYLSRLPQLAGEANAASMEGAKGARTGAGESGVSQSEPPSAGGDLSGPGRTSSGENGRDEEDGSVPLLGRVHPLVVHFPLAGLPLALLGLLIWLATGRDAFARADVVPLFASTLAAVAAVITGDAAHEAIRFSPSLESIAESHESFATAVLVLTLVLSALRLWRWKDLAGNWRHVYSAGLVIVCVLVAITGYLGGSLVFGPDHFRW